MPKIAQCLASANWHAHRVPQPDPTSEQVPLLFRDFDGPRHDGPSGHVSPSVDRQHPVAKVGRLAALRDAGRLHADVAVVVVEQAGAGAEQDRSEVDAYGVDEASARIWPPMLTLNRSTSLPPASPMATSAALRELRTKV